MSNREPVYYCAQCSRVLHRSQVSNGTHQIARLNAGKDGYRFETHKVSPMPEDERPIVVRLTEEEAALTNHAIGYLLIQLMREGGAANDARIGVLSGIAVRLQFAKEGITP